MQLRELDMEEDVEEDEGNVLTKVFFQLLQESLGIAPEKGRIEREEILEEDSTETGERDDYVIGTHKADWSNDALKLQEYWKTKNFKPLDEDFLCSYFTHLNLLGRKISQIDSNARKFTSLKTLSLSANVLQSIENLPPNLEVLNVHGNK